MAKGSLFKAVGVRPKGYKFPVGNITNVDSTRSNDFYSSTGGTKTISGDYVIHTFNSSDTFNSGINLGPLSCDFLVVAGGGAGGVFGGGGGGAGGVLYGSGMPIIAGKNYTVTIGAGGDNFRYHPNFIAAGANGSNSSIGTFSPSDGDAPFVACMPDYHPSPWIAPHGIPQANGVVIAAGGGGGGSSAAYLEPYQITNPGTPQLGPGPASPTSVAGGAVPAWVSTTYGLPGGSGGGTAVGMSHGGNPQAPHPQWVEGRGSSMLTPNYSTPQYTGAAYEPGNPQVSNSGRTGYGGGVGSIQAPTFPYAGVNNYGFQIRDGMGGGGGGATENGYPGRSGSPTGGVKDSATSTIGAGGSGVNLSISGSPVYYGGGGGGGCIFNDPAYFAPYSPYPSHASVGGLGGDGGGGKGGNGYGSLPGSNPSIPLPGPSPTGGDWHPYSGHPTGKGTDGSANRGGGGGGGGGTPPISVGITGGIGGTGGSGIVIIRYNKTTTSGYEIN